jgi:hypothetical protein
MNAALSSDQILQTPVGVLAQTSSAELFQLRSSVAERLAKERALQSHIDAAIDFRFGDRVNRLRLELGKESGVVHLDDGNVRVTSELKKEVHWDQAKLAQISARISQSGEDVHQYIDISYSVPESRFKAWPETLRASFLEARTVKSGRVSYRLALMKE